MKKILPGLIISAFLFSFNNSFAASFQSLEQSAARLGVADSGTTTNTDNAAIEFYNPAGMPLLKRPTITGSGIGVLANIKMSNAQASDAATPPAAVTGDTSGPTSEAIVPAFHFVMPISYRTAFGFGVTVPYGLETIYPDNTVARYFATVSKISTINLGFSWGYRATDNFLVGFGLDFQRMWAELDQAIDPANAGGITNAIMKNRGGDWGFGVNAGVLYLLSPQTRIGFAYRSEIKHHMRGSSVTNLPPATALTFGLMDSGVSSNITLPATATLSIQHLVNPRWMLTGDIQFTNWNVLHDLTLNFDNPNRSVRSATLQLHYHNTWRFAVGQSYHLTPHWIIRNGFAFDQTPTDKTYKTARIPGSNRYWVTLGTNYKMNSHVDFDLGYAFIYFAHSHVNLSEAFPLGGNDTFSADYRGYANLIGAQVNIHVGSV